MPDRVILTFSADAHPPKPFGIGSVWQGYRIVGLSYTIPGYYAVRL